MEKNQKLINALMNAGSRLDHSLATEFLINSIEAEQATLDLIRGTLTEAEEMRRERVLNQGAFLLALVGYGLSQSL